MLRSLFLLFLFLGKTSASQNWLPAWFEEKDFITKEIIITNCMADGPDYSSAKIAAINDCNMSAHSVINSEIEAHSITVATESRIAFHSEMLSSNTYKNLNCIPLNEAFQETKNSFRAFIRCKFELKKTTFKTVISGTQPPNTRGRIKDLKIQHKVKRIDSEKYTLAIVTIPKCSDIIVRGGTPRILPCENPTHILLDNNDKSIIIRSDKARPRNIDLIGISKNRQTNQSIQVIMDR